MVHGAINQFLPIGHNAFYAFKPQTYRRKFQTSTVRELSKLLEVLAVQSYLEGLGFAFGIFFYLLQQVDRIPAVSSNLTHVKLLDDLQMH